MASNKTDELHDEGVAMPGESDDPMASTVPPTESEPATADTGGIRADDVPGGHDAEALLPEDQSERFNVRWEEIQSSFVDKPQEAVEQADALVVDLMQRVTGGFSTERERLEGQWPAARTSRRRICASR
jgi:hypothetical protein